MNEPLKKYCSDLRDRSLSWSKKLVDEVRHNQRDRDDLVSEGACCIIARINSCEKQGKFPSIRFLKMAAKRSMIAYSQNEFEHTSNAANFSGIAEGGKMILAVEHKGFEEIEQEDELLNSDFWLEITAILDDIELDAIKARFVDGLRIKEWAEKRDISEGKARNIHFTGMKKIREHLKGKNENNIEHDDLGDDMFCFVVNGVRRVSLSGPVWGEPGEQGG